MAVEGGKYVSISHKYENIFIFSVLFLYQLLLGKWCICLPGTFRVAALARRQRRECFTPATLHSSNINVNTLRPRQNGRHFADDIFKYISLNENVWISIKNSLKFVPKGPISNIPALGQRSWLGADQVTSHNLSQWWLDYRRIYTILGFNELSQRVPNKKRFRERTVCMAYVGIILDMDSADERSDLLAGEN